MVLRNIDELNHSIRTLNALFFIVDDIFARRTYIEMSREDIENLSEMIANAIWETKENLKAISEEETELRHKKSL